MDVVKRTNGDYAAAFAEIAHAPAADVAPVVHSRWVKINSAQGRYCLECGVKFDLYAYCKDLYRHCPNCGAKMDLTEDCL